MVSRFVPALAGVAMAATVGSALAFNAEIVAPKALRTHPSPRASVISVIPSGAVINMERCVRGWCEAAYAGQLGYVYTPVLVSTTPAVSPWAIDEGPLGILAAPITLPLAATGAVAGAPWYPGQVAAVP